MVQLEDLEDQEVLEHQGVLEHQMEEGVEVLPQEEEVVVGLLDQVEEEAVDHLFQVEGEEEEDHPYLVEEEVEEVNRVHLEGVEVVVDLLQV